VSDTRPHLKAVGTEAKDGAAAGAAARPPQAEAPSSRRTWLIVALFVLACLALVIQTRRVGALSGEVTRLSTELVGTRAALVAYEGRLATVREVVGDLSQRLAQLDELVRRDPLAPIEPATAPPVEP
jgi:hypothetical protein